MYGERKREPKYKLILQFLNEKFFKKKFWPHLLKINFQMNMSVLFPAMFNFLITYSKSFMPVIYKYGFTLLSNFMKQFYSNSLFAFCTSLALSLLELLFKSLRTSFQSPPSSIPCKLLEVCI